MNELAKQYDPFDIEAKWVKRWAEEPYAADATSSKPALLHRHPAPQREWKLALGPRV